MKGVLYQFACRDLWSAALFAIAIACEGEAFLAATGVILLLNCTISVGIAAISAGLIAPIPGIAPEHASYFFLAGDALSSLVMVLTAGADAGTLGNECRLDQKADGIPRGIAMVAACSIAPMVT